MWSWGGHVNRTDPMKWIYAVTVREPRKGSRSVGRQGKMWCNVFKREIESMWSRVTTERQVGKNHKH